MAKILLLVGVASSLTLPKHLVKPVVSAALAAGLTLAPLSAPAADKRSVGAIAGSGFLFKDRLVVDGFSDPQIGGVTIYISDFERPVTERLQKDFFSDPSQAGLSCARKPKVEVKGELSTSGEGEEIVTESKSLLFKTLRVRRIYDKDTNTAVYVAFSTRLNKGDDANKARFSSSLCAIPLDN